MLCWLAGWLPITAVGFSSLPTCHHLAHLSSVSYANVCCNALPEATRLAVMLGVSCYYDTH